MHKVVIKGNYYGRTRTLPDLNDYLHECARHVVYILPQPLLERYLVYSGRLPAQSEISFVLRSLWLLKMRHISW